MGPELLYMSGYAEHTIVSKGVVEEGVMLLQKPLTPDMLLAKFVRRSTFGERAIRSKASSCRQIADTLAKMAARTLDLLVPGGEVVTWEWGHERRII